MADRNLAIIADRRTTESELQAAIRRLRMPAQEPPSYWTAIANDKAYRHDHRVTAIGQLFKRHVHTKMRLRDLVKVLSLAKWLHPEATDKVTRLSGFIPVQMGHGDSVFVIRFLPEPRKDVSGVFLRIHGEIAESDFKQLLFDPLFFASKSKYIENNLIFEIGF